MPFKMRIKSSDSSQIEKCIVMSTTRSWPWLNTLNDEWEQKAATPQKLEFPSSLSVIILIFCLMPDTFSKQTSISSILSTIFMLQLSIKNSFPFCHVTELWHAFRVSFYAFRVAKVMILLFILCLNNGRRSPSCMSFVTLFPSFPVRTNKYCQT